MAEFVNMPKLGFDMAEGTLVRWIISEGSPVEKGEVLAEIETDKATIEVEASVGGVVLKHVVPEGTAVPIGEPIAVVGAEGEEVDLGSIGAAEPAPAEAAEAAAPEPTRAAAPVMATAPAAGDSTDGRLPAGVRASPVARRLAREKEIDLLGLQGSGPGGRIVKDDVEAAIQQAEAVPAAPAYAPVLPGGPTPTERVPLTRLRSAIGRRMTAAKQQLPHFYVTVELDADPMMALRAELNDLLPEDAAKISVNDFLVKAAALSLREFPNLNASLDGDEIIRHGDVNIGIAVAVEGGLLTVVVHDADRKSIHAISSDARRMIANAREGKVHPEEIEGSTFTLSNLGMFAVEHFIAIINPPEAAILAIGSVRDVPVVKDGQVVAGRTLKVTLSADHRVTDGAEAAEWLRSFRGYIEQPLRLLL